MSYVDAATLKLYLGVDTDVDDDLLLRAIGAAQSIIDTQCSRQFEAVADTTRYFDPMKDSDDYRQLFFDEDLCQITSVTNGDSSVISPSQYVTNPRNYTPYYSISLKLNAGAYWVFNGTPENAIAITGRWAYSLTAPEDIQQACLRLAAWIYRQRDTSSGEGITAPILTNSGAVIMPSKLPADVMSLITPYIRKLQ